QTGTHCWHCVHACTKPITSAETMCSSSTAWFSCAIVTCLASGSGHASRQSLHPMQAMISRSTSLRRASKKSTCAINCPPPSAAPLETERDLAEPDLGARVDRDLALGLDPLAVHAGAVGAPEVGDRPRRAVRGESRVLPAHRRLREGNVRARAAAA